MLHNNQKKSPTLMQGTVSELDYFFDGNIKETKNIKRTTQTRFELARPKPYDIVQYSSHTH